MVRRKWVIRVAAGWLIFIALLLAGCSGHNKELQVLGYIEGKYINMSSSVSGILQERPIYRGVKVKENQELFVLDPYPEKAELEKSQDLLEQAQQNLKNLIKGQRETILEAILAELSQAKASLVLSELDLKRRQKLYLSEAVGKAELDAAVATHKRDVGRVKQLEANLAEAKLGGRANLILAQQAAVEAQTEDVAKWKWQLEQKTVKAPMDALVFDTFYRVGEYVSAGSPVMSLLAPKYVRVLFFVPQKYLSRIETGQTIYFTCDGCAKRVPATVHFISNEAEYTPPVIYSKDTRDNLVYRIEAWLDPKTALNYHPGEPVQVYLPLAATHSDKQNTLPQDEKKVSPNKTTMPPTPIKPKSN